MLFIIKGAWISHTTPTDRAYNGAQIRLAIHRVSLKIHWKLDLMICCILLYTSLHETRQNCLIKGCHSMV